MAQQNHTRSDLPTICRSKSFCKTIYNNKWWANGTTKSRSVRFAHHFLFKIILQKDFQQQMVGKRHNEITLGEICPPVFVQNDFAKCFSTTNGGQIAQQDHTRSHLPTICRSKSFCKTIFNMKWWANGTTKSHSDRFAHHLLFKIILQNGFQQQMVGKWHNEIPLGPICPKFEVQNHFAKGFSTTDGGQTAQRNHAR